MVLGIDPGISEGAFTLLNLEGKVVEYWRMPKIKGTSEADANKIMDILSDDRITHIWLEDVHSIPGSSAKSNFSFGKNVGLLQGLLYLSGKSWTLVNPKTWQKVAWQGIRVVKKSGGKGNDTKATSKIAAARLFPEENFIPLNCRSANQGCIDAALIAYYGLKNR